MWFIKILTIGAHNDIDTIGGSCYWQRIEDKLIERSDHLITFKDYNHKGFLHDDFSNSIPSTSRSECTIETKTTTTLKIGVTFASTSTFFHWRLGSTSFCELKSITLFMQEGDYYIIVGFWSTRRHVVLSIVSWITHRRFIFLTASLRIDVSWASERSCSNSGIWRLMASKRIRSSWWSHWLGSIIFHGWQPWCSGGLSTKSRKIQNVTLVIGIDGRLKSQYCYIYCYQKTLTIFLSAACSLLILRKAPRLYTKVSEEVAWGEVGPAKTESSSDACVDDEREIA